MATKRLSRDVLQAIYDRQRADWTRQAESDAQWMASIGRAQLIYLDEIEAEILAAKAEES